jgi:hypothetical protein
MSQNPTRASRTLATVCPHSILPILAPFWAWRFRKWAFESKHHKNMSARSGKSGMGFSAPCRSGERSARGSPAPGGSSSSSKAAVL